LAQNNIPQADAISRLVTELNKLPGIGTKSAQRLAFFLLRSPQEQSNTWPRQKLETANQIVLGLL
jgi:recombination protein RecR